MSITEFARLSEGEINAHIEMVLAQEHRAAQARLALGLTKDILTIWRFFDPQRIDESWGQMLRYILVATSESRLKSAITTESYYQTLRTAHGLRAALAARRVAGSEAWRRSAIVSLEIQGPIRAKIAVSKKEPLEVISQNALVRVSGAAQRHALDGGRETLYELARGDGVVRFKRITRGPAACVFCRMLAGRGAVYVQQTASFRSHDHCMCTAAPDFTAPRKFTRKPTKQPTMPWAKPSDAVIAPKPEQPWGDWGEPRPAHAPDIPWTMRDYAELSEEDRERVVEALTAWERENITNNRFETLYAVKPNGEIVGEWTGSSGSVTVGRGEWIGMRDAILTHNHPGDDRYGPQRIANFVSPQDMLTAQKYGVRAIRAARFGDGVSQVVIHPKWQGAPPEMFRQEILSIYDNVLDELRDAHGGDEATINRVASDHLGRAFHDAGLIIGEGFVPDEELLK